LALVYDGAGGWYDDGSGDRGVATSSPPRLHNLPMPTITLPAAQRAGAVSLRGLPHSAAVLPAVADFYSVESQPPAYQKQDPFKLPTVSDFYTQESQGYQQPIPKANSPWWLPQQPQSQPDYSQWDQSNYTYGQQQQANPFTSDGSASNFYEQESGTNPSQYGYNGSPLYQPDRAYYDQQQGTQGSGGSWPIGPDYGTSGSFGPGSDWNGTSNAGSAAQFYGVESQAAPQKENPFSYTLQQEMNRPRLPYEQGYDPQVGSEIDPSKLFESASPETMKNTDPFNMALNTLGAAIAPIGMGIDATADSGIPGVSQAAGTVRNAWEQVVEPVGNMLSATVGDLAAGRAGPYTPVFDPFDLKHPGQTGGQKALEAVSSIWDPQKAAELDAWRQAQMQQEYANQIAAGKSPQEANAAATRLGVKLVNPLNYAEYQGLQDFSQLPAVVQLPLMFADPIGNAVYGAALKPLTHALPAAIGKVAEKTGAAKVIDAVLENTVRAPEQRAYRFGQVSDRVVSTLDQAAESVGTTAAEVLPDFLFNKASPIYYEKVMPGVAKDRLAQQTIDRVSYAYNNSPLYEGKAKDTAITGGKVAPAEASLAVKAQDTTGQVDPFSTNAEPTRTPTRRR
jgi:hypothetical protein